MSLYTLCNSHKKIFSSSFLEKHHNIILYDVLHQSLAFLLFPTNGLSTIGYRYEELREKVILSLNVALYNKIEDEKIKKEEKNYEYSYIRGLLKIPDDRAFPALSLEAYPLWLIKEDFQKIDAENYFRSIERFVWALLRSDDTREAYASKKSHAIPEKEEGVSDQGQSLLKANVIKFQRKDLSTPQKTFEDYFKIYKPFCHLVAAYECIKRETQQEWQFSLSQPQQIQRFLNIAYWFRKSLLSLKTSTIPEEKLFLEKDLLSLPLWAQSDEVEIPEPLGSTIHEMPSL